jgi:hypothetical protein
MDPKQERLFPARDRHLRVAGAASYQDAIWQVVGEPTPPDDRPSWVGQARLEPEPTNPHDPNAVKIVVDGRTVGYLERSLARRLQAPIRRIEEREGAHVAVPAECSGGFRLPNGDRAHVGLVLRFDPDEIEAAGS